MRCYNLRKQSKRKWNKVHFFKKKKSSRRQVGHPVLVYATSKEDYRYLTFTHKKEKGKEDDYEPLKYNVDENDTQPCYVKKTFGQNHSSLFNPPHKNYRVHNADKNTVNKYKKY